nr:hypothetical protein [uncultured Draconibacterium sp.]
MNDDEKNIPYYPGKENRIDIDKTERRIGNTERSDLEFYLQQKEAKDIYDKMTNASTADSFGDALDTTLLNRTKNGLSKEEEDYLYETTPSSDYTDSYDQKTDSPNNEFDDTFSVQDIEGYTSANIKNVNYNYMDENLNSNNDKVNEFDDNNSDITEVPQEDINEVIDGESEIEEITDPSIEFEENANEITEVPFDENQESEDLTDPSTEFSENSDDITYDDSNDITDDFSENASDITETNEDPIEPDTYDNNYEPPMP